MDRRNAPRETNATTNGRRGGLLLAAAFICCLVAGGTGRAEQAAAPSLEAWKAKVEPLAPAKPTAEPATGQPRRLLVFSLFTGFNHAVIPYVDEVFQILGNKSGAFTATISRDLECLAADSLAQYDVLVLNNNCSVAPRRNLLLDELERNPRYQGLSESERSVRAAELERSMLDFVRNGKGLVLIHGAPVLLNNSPDFTEMVGGAFDYHPRSQEVTIRPVGEDHPLLAAFAGKPFVHRDEPYCFSGAYAKKNFRPLLVIDADKVDDGDRGKFKQDVRYTAWIKPYGRGRVFYCSPSHFEASYESPVMLRFLLDGTQYAAGDLKCDDRPATAAREPGRGGNLPDNLVVERDLVYGDAGNRPLKLDLIRPREPGPEALPLIVFIHGGGWRNGDKAGGVGRLLPFVATGKYIGATVGYRLSGEATWPAQIHDCKAAIRWLKANAATYHIDPERIGVWGSSAGGHLVNMLGVSANVPELEGSCGSPEQSSRVACVVSFCGPANFLAPREFEGGRRPSAVDLLLGGKLEERKDLAQQASPLTYVSADDPPFLIVHGTQDRTVPFEQAEMFHQALQQAGVEATFVKILDGGHNVGGDEVLRRVTAFFEKRLRGQDVAVSSEPIAAPQS